MICTIAQSVMVLWIYHGICGSDHPPFACFAVCCSFVINLMLWVCTNQDDLVQQYVNLLWLQLVGCVP